MSGRPCIYVNTSIVIRALNSREPGHHEARRLLEECSRRCKCVYSIVHEIEMPAGRYRELASYLDGIGAVRSRSGPEISWLRRAAEDWLRARGRSLSRLEDTMHLLAAQSLGCKYILARDRFIWPTLNTST